MVGLAQRWRSHLRGPLAQPGTPRARLPRDLPHFRHHCGHGPLRGDHAAGHQFALRRCARQAECQSVAHLRVRIYQHIHNAW
jgi:hypothetical protein